MLLCEYINKLEENLNVSFEYCYYGKNNQMIRDESLSISGSKEEVLKFVNANEMLMHIFACAGECNDFETLTSEGHTTIRFIDFR